MASIVEGDGERSALPVLLRRLGQWRTPGTPTEALPPIRVYKDRFLNREAEFRRHLELAAKKSGDTGWILIVLDADDDCPAQRGAEIARRARLVVPHRRLAVVLAIREYEAWFIAASASLQGVRNYSSLLGDELADAESPRNAKGWIERRMAGRSYEAVTDQAAFSAQMDLQQAFDRSRSFRKLCTEWSKNVESKL